MRRLRLRNPIAHFVIPKMEAVLNVRSWQVRHNGKGHLLIDINWWCWAHLKRRPKWWLVGWAWNDNRGRRAG
jgi:hypothetical protein